MKGKRFCKQVLGITITMIGSGVFWQFLVGGVLVIGITGIVLVSLGIYLILADQFREQEHYHHPVDNHPPLVV